MVDDIEIAPRESNVVFSAIDDDGNVVFEVDELGNKTYPDSTELKKIKKEKK